MLGIGGTELVIILFFGFLIFGPEKLPQMGRTVGRAIRQFREASDIMSKRIKTEVTDPFEDAISPYKGDIEEMARPIQEDVNAINATMKETQEALTNPFKDVFKPSGSSSASTANKGTRKTGAVISSGSTSSSSPTKSKKSLDKIAAASDPANDAAPAIEPREGSSADADPFAGIASGDRPSIEPATPETKPLPDTAPTSSIAASLYGLDSDAPAATPAADDVSDSAKDGE